VAAHPRSHWPSSSVPRRSCTTDHRVQMSMLRRQAPPSSSNGCSAIHSIRLFGRFSWGVTCRLLPVGRSGHKTMVQHGEHLRVSGGKVLIGRVPLCAALPARLRSGDKRTVPFGSEGKHCTRSRGAHVRKAVRRERVDYNFFLRHEAHDSAASCASGKLHQLCLAKIKSALQ
jgi:hypothetical protein